MKKIVLIAAALLAFAGSASAVDVPNQFNVTINFTGSCQVKTPASDFTFTYAAFDATAKTGSTSTVFKCSRGLTPTFSFDNPGGAQTGSTGVALGAALSAEGVIAGIRYTLSGSSAKTAGTPASAGTGGSGGSDGTPDEYTVNIGANIAAGQAGNGATGGGTQLRTLTITY